jgi:hypothetical protein
MRKTLTRMFGGLATALIASIAAAQPSVPQAVDCAKARNPERCEARQKAREACQDKRGADRRQCVKEHMPPPDCSKAANPARCAALLAAQDACKGKVGPAHRQCLRDAVPPARP